ncbi:phage portal protein [Enterococcus sp.]|uniref:phage portal protein n=1 Tax=Enterococcus sp. TaxID=35783 RepID=UPI002FCAAC35
MGLWNNFRNWVSGEKRYMTIQEKNRKRYGYWKRNSIYLDNIYNKISVDVAMMNFKHVKVTKGDSTVDKWEVYENSDLMNAIAFSPNLDEPPIVFWSSVIRMMLEKGIAVVVPTYDGDKIRDLTLATGNIRFNDTKILVTINDIEKEVNKADVWVFENPKQNLTAQLHQITQLIDDNLSALSAKINDSPSSTVFGFLKFPTKVADGELKERAEKRVKDIQTVAQNGGITYLEKDEEFQELNKKISTASAEELNFLKSQLFQSFGINEDLFTGNYSEAQFKGYFSSVLKVYQRVIKEEINRKYFTKTARTQGQKLMVFYDLFDLTSIKDLTEFGYKMTYSAISSPNEIRELVGWLPYEDGNIFKSNANAVDIVKEVSE